MTLVLVQEQVKILMVGGEHLVHLEDLLAIILNLNLLKKYQRKDVLVKMVKHILKIVVLKISRLKYLNFLNLQKDQMQNGGYKIYLD